MTLFSARQHTLASSVDCEGIGIHSGKPAKIRLEPAPEGAGVRFIRPVGQALWELEATWRNVVDTRLCTTLGNASGFKVATVEHLMAALVGCGVDNVSVVVAGEELPILDGSSAGFVNVIQEAGISRQSSIRRVLKVLKPVRVEEGEAFLELTPSSHFEATVEVPLKGMGVQHFHYSSAEHTFEDIASARTFSLLEQVQQMQAAGFIQGGSLENAVVLDGEKVLNPEGLRFPEECARHKVLDLIGDLALAGAPIIGHVQGRYPGHRLNHLLLRSLMLEEKAWELAPPPKVTPQKTPSFWVAATQPVAVFGTSAYNR